MGETSPLIRAFYKKWNYLNYCKLSYNLEYWYLNSIEQIAQFLFRDVKKASVNHTDINKGDHIIVTGASDDIIGIVNNTDTIGDTTSIVLNTSSGEKALQVSSKNFIHIIQRADMLNMRNHIEYERDLKDVNKGTHKLTEKDQHPVFNPVEKSDKSELPSSKISLMMKKKKTSAYESEVLEAINALGLFALRQQDKWQIVNYTGLDPYQVDEGLSTIDPDLLDATLQGNLQEGTRPADIYERGLERHKSEGGGYFAKPKDIYERGLE